jgi:hypothetical protein
MQNPLAPEIRTLLPRHAQNSGAKLRAADRISSVPIRVIRGQIHFQTLEPPGQK